MKNKNILSFQLNVDDFLPATDEEKQSLVLMRPGVSFWKDALRRLYKNKVAMVSLAVIIFIMIFSFVIPSIYPYKYDQQIQGSEYLKPMTFSKQEISLKDAGQKVFPHILGTDNLGRDYAVRVMMGSRISLLVGLIASALILIIGYSDR